MQTKQSVAFATIMVLLLASGRASGQVPALFRSTPTFAVGDKPNAITSCDLNEDGLPDVVTTNEGFDDIAVLLNDGMGGFLPQVRFGVDVVDPRQVACVDLDNDMNLDLLIAGGNSVVALRGNGDGTFGVGTIALGLTGTISPSFDVAFIDADNLLDIVTVGGDGTNIWFGEGNFEFSAPQQVGAFSFAVLVRAVDLDNDTFVDIVQVNNSRVLWGDAIGGFPESTPFSTGTSSSIVLANVDGDKHIDILLSEPLTGSVRLLRGLPNRQFAAPISVSVGPSPSQLGVVDLDNDMLLDLVTTNEGSNDVTVRLGNSDGTFQPEVRFGTGDNPRGLTVADFDDDGLLDIATVNFSSDDVSLLLGNGDGTFRWEPRFPVGTDARSVVACDLNNDNIVDLASVNFATDEVSVLIGEGGGTYMPEVRYPVAEGPIAIECADLKEDGARDLIVANFTSSEVSVLLGNGDGTFSAKPRFSVGGRPLDITLCDVDGDLHLDVITADGGTPSLLFGLGNGFFGPAVDVPLSQVSRAVCADINGDERPDLVYGRFTAVYTALGDGEGNFSFVDVESVSGTITGIVVAKLDSDDVPDVAVVSSVSSAGLRAFRVNPSGSLTALGPAIPVGADGMGIVASKVDDDDTIDIVVTNFSDDDVSVFLNNGFGNFTDEGRFGVGEEPRGIVTADVDNDGDDDLVVANAASSSISVLFNTVFEAPIFIDDFDGDGVLDGVDNCPELANGDQKNFDGDSMGDACDLDIDNDNVVNALDVCDFTPVGSSVQTDGGLRADADGDCDVDLIDWSIMQLEFTGPGVPQ